MADKSSTLATMATNIKLGLEAWAKDLHTCLPGIIKTFDPVKQTASVQPAIKRVFKTDTGAQDILKEVDLPLLINVPVQFSRGGGFSFTFPVAPGDECLLHFSERAIDGWHEFGEIRKPLARRFHDLSDAVAVVGVSSIPNKIPDFDSVNAQIKKDDGSVKITLYANGNLKAEANGDVIVVAGGKLDATATTVCDITAPVINLNGDVNISGLTTMLASASVTGTMTNNGVNIGSTHLHPQGVDSGGNTEQPTGVPY